MLDWGFLIDESALASVLPDDYARFRRPVSGALAVFLGGLPAARQAAILADQMSLPPAANAAQRLALLALACPTLHKLGQVLARDRRLCPELRQRLQALESLPPTIPLETFQGILARELGPLDRLGVTLEPPALAEASVAVVIPFRDDRAPREGRPRQGVFKVLKPEVVERLEQELELFERVGSYLDQRCDDFHIPQLDYRDAFDQARDKLQYEVRFDHEQRHLVLARAAYEGDRQVQIPVLLDHCTPRVTAMERVSGGKVTDHGLGSGREKSRLANLVGEALIARPIFSRASQALFHADPHPGNLFLTEDGRLAILDWSLVGFLGEPERVAIAQIVLAALTLDAEQIVTLLTGLAQQGVHRPALESVVHTWLGRIRWGRFPGLTWLVGLLDEAVGNARLRLGADLMLFRKMLHTLEGVVADIGGDDGCTDRVLLGEFLRHLVVEWPLRWLALPGSRAFATRLSNADLAEFLLSLPWAGPRFWLKPALYPR